MTSDPIQLDRADHVAVVTLNDPDRRNAMTEAMFHRLLDVLASCASDESIRVVRLTGAGTVFCSGFDLAAVVEDPPLMGRLINELSALVRCLRRMPQPVVAEVRGAAIAGGCAAVSGCDFTVASRTARFGYPVHPMGVSPGVTIPTLQQKLNPGGARALLLSSRLVDGATAHRLGLVTHLVETDDDVREAADDLCRRLAGHGPHAMRVTKAWLNELDGSLDDATFDGCRDGTAALADGEEAIAMLRAFWSNRSDRGRH